MASEANTRSIAEATDLDQRTVRQILRKLEKDGTVEKPEEGWSWPSEKDATYRSVVKAVQAEHNRPKTRGRQAAEDRAPEPKAESKKTTKVESKKPTKKAA